MIEMQTNQPLVSIIIPVFNRESIVKETLDSVKNQDYFNLECIIVDDGSTDNTVAVVKQYIAKDSRFKLFRRPDNYASGGNGARNYGFSQTNGVYLQWLDSDDLLKPSKISKQVKQFQYHPEINLCLCGVLVFNNTEKYSKPNSTIPESHLFESYATKETSIGTNQPLWKKEFLESKKLYDEKVVRGQDYDFFVRMFSEANINYKNVNENLVLVRSAGNDRITKVYKSKIDSKFAQSYLTGYRRAYQIFSSRENEKYYVKMTNLIIKKLLKFLSIKDFETVILTLKFLKKNTFQHRSKYKIHFLKAILIIRLLQITRLRGYKTLKNKLFITN